MRDENFNSDLDIGGVGALHISDLFSDFYEKEDRGHCRIVGTHCGKIKEYPP